MTKPAKTYYFSNPGPAEQRRSGCAIFLAVFLSWLLIFAVVAIIGYLVCPNLLKMY